MTFLQFSLVMRIFEQELTEQLLNSNYGIFPEEKNSLSLWERVGVRAQDTNTLPLILSMSKGHPSLLPEGEGAKRTKPVNQIKNAAIIVQTDF